MSRQKIGIIRGTFKILTANHCLLINEAKKLFDKVVVCIDSDWRLKQNNKLLVLNQGERMCILTSLGVDVRIFKDENEFVQIVGSYKTIFNCEVYYIKGADYKISELPESKVLLDKYQISTLTIGPFDGKSTTEICKIIQQEMNKKDSELPIHVSV